MQELQGKNIVLGVTGGIAAYKAPEFVRRLKDHGADVRVVMTEGAKAFITPLTLQAVSANPVSDSLLDPQAELAMGHIELAKWADVVIIAPATADTLAKVSHGLASDLLTTICLATAAPIVVAPAMNQQMWKASATQHNMDTLVSRGVTVWGPGVGDQACGDIGAGRMLDVPELVELTLLFFQEKTLGGQHWVITAGPTREAIDPVRYISNHSSGKMGYAIAQAAVNAGANVTIISGPVSISAPAGCKVINVESAEQMHQAAMKQSDNADVFIACAAVADYRAADIAPQKMKKSSQDMSISLVRNPDIVKDVAAKANKPFVVGFAAETQDVETYALGKLTSKKLDMICANDVSIATQGFNANQNALTVFDKDSSTEIPLADKAMVATQLVKLIAEKRS
ncbi:bifunctional phosphopantothenoylcysteine decarboxylase/phosphopantothenate--cysteine ligase CoaBC [Thalassotalea agarivorans]|uniref:Coenzyme A biosynthesis bifunctional protein CoaBC n=1 Tax=Thalassotalea agarivorans TaxID=349064 RepID=A0A1I0CLC8_THASX|nr:bifunctional phosphopantothenoylcysteine decarboxylase/phosphopantothenate--cysteine ligase CoaBC [Thalassotalea agarivorans]SET20480.1 phosphopantothenoylcysteine decarboxylase / phosphopantothenate--cysteine ligase [Thalassotalea agarivorans]